MLAAIPTIATTARSDPEYSRPRPAGARETHMYSFCRQPRRPRYSP
jgi:hypothetical protein